MGNHKTNTHPAPRKSVTPLTSICFLGFSLTSIGFLDTFAVSSFTILSVVVLSLYLRSMSPIKQWSFIVLVYFLPLLLFHGILNQQFVTSNHIGIIPIRDMGIAFAIEIGIPIMSLFSAIIFFGYVQFDQAVTFLLRFGLPVWVIVLLSQGFSLTQVVKKKIDSVFIAQKARGVPVKAGVIKRALSLIPILIPVVISSVIEADEKGFLLSTRGFGQHKIVKKKIVIKDEVDRYLLMLISIFIFVTILSLTNSL